MIIVETNQMEFVIEKARQEGFSYCIGLSKRVITIFDNNGKEVSLKEFGSLPGVIKAFPLAEAYRLTALTLDGVDRIMERMKQ